jgi:hypothetical protein
LDPHILHYLKTKVNTGRVNAGGGIQQCVSEIKEHTWNLPCWQVFFSCRGELCVLQNFENLLQENKNKEVI